MHLIGTGAAPYVAGLRRHLRLTWSPTVDIRAELDLNLWPRRQRLSLTQKSGQPNWPCSQCGAPNMRTKPDNAALLSPARLDQLFRLQLLDTPPEEPFDRLTRLAARTLGAPIALVSLVDDHRQFFKSSFGLPEPWASQRETPLSHSFCQHVVASGSPLRIEDAREHPLVCDNPAITALSVIAYLGVPLKTPEGRTLGSLCVISPRPTMWGDNDQLNLLELGASVMSEIALRRAHDDLLAANARLLQEAAVRDATMRELSYREARLDAAQRLAHVGSFELRTAPAPDSHWSCEARRIMGIVHAEPPTSIDAFVTTLVHPEDRDRVAAALWNVTRQKLTMEIEYRACLSDGTIKTLLTAIEGQPGPQSASTAICTAFDVTVRYQAEAALAEYRNQLWHVARVATAGEMAAVIAHELNQPLAAIAHTANACGRLSAGKNLSNCDLAQHLQSISTQARRASEIIRQMRSYVRRQPPTQQPLDLDQIVDEILTMLAPMTRNLSIKLRRSLPGKLPQVLGDEVQLGQLVLNLVRNAYDAVETNSLTDRCVEVITSSPDPEVVLLEVSDNGPGIHPEQKDKIFEPFFTTRSNGLGMGLSIARTIAETHGAVLCVGTKIPAQHGAIFRVSFTAFDQ